jgi:hypothetical protein
MKYREYVAAFFFVIWASVQSEVVVTDSTEKETLAIIKSLPVKNMDQSVENNLHDKDLATGFCLKFP